MKQHSHIMDPQRLHCRPHTTDMPAHPPLSAARILATHLKLVPDSLRGLPVYTAAHVRHT